MIQVIRLSARAFVSTQTQRLSQNSKTGAGIEVLSKQGGNPVTVFLPSALGNSASDNFERLTPNQLSDLARTCPWESVVIEDSTSSESDNYDADHVSRPKFRFFMPSGEEVSFCAHAAMGACAFLANRESLVASVKNLKWDTETNPPEKRISDFIASFMTSDGHEYDAKVRGDQVQLFMQTNHYEKEITASAGSTCDIPSLEDFLHEIDLDTDDVPSTSAMGDMNTKWPTFLNSSVAREKTLIPIKSADRLHAANPPKDPDKFREMCDAIDSTGIYLYSTTPKDVIAKAVANNGGLIFETRQFPRASGYAEDPATGIAAGALAASLFKSGIGCSVYNVFQGTAMGRRSEIDVAIENYDQTTSAIDLSYTGSIAFDSLSLLPPTNP